MVVPCIILFLLALAGVRADDRAVRECLLVIAISFIALWWLAWHLLNLPA